MSWALQLTQLLTLALGDPVQYNDELFAYDARMGTVMLQMLSKEISQMDGDVKMEDCEGFVPILADYTHDLVTSIQYSPHYEYFQLMRSLVWDLWGVSGNVTFKCREAR